MQDTIPPPYIAPHNPHTYKLAAAPPCPRVQGEPRQVTAEHEQGQLAYFDHKASECPLHIFFLLMDMSVRAHICLL
jgi:hypothetical protein